MPEFDDSKNTVRTGCNSDAIAFGGFLIPHFSLARKVPEKHHTPHCIVMIVR
jgi:hypothetical protein